MNDTADKYRDQVDPKHKMAMDAVGLMRTILGPHRAQLQAVIDAERRMHNLGHFIHPTLYKDMISSKSFPLQIRLIKAALAFLDETDAVADDLVKLAGGQQ